jgi:hypothetical protein
MFWRLKLRWSLVMRAENQNCCSFLDDEGKNAAIAWLCASFMGCDGDISYLMAWDEWYCRRFYTLNVICNTLWSTWRYFDIMTADFAKVKPILQYCVNTLALTVATSLQIDLRRDYPHFIPISVICSNYAQLFSLCSVNRKFCPLPGYTLVGTKMWTSPRCSDLDIFICVRSTVIACNFSGPLIYLTALIPWITCWLFSELSCVGMGKHFETYDCICHPVSVSTQCYQGLKHM